MEAIHFKAGKQFSDGITGKLQGELTRPGINHDDHMEDSIYLQIRVRDIIRPPDGIHH